MDDFASVAADLAALPDKVVRQGRGITARHVDAAASAAQAKALSTWTTYGRGMQGSAGTIRGRMSRDRGEIVGYVFADGEGAYRQEHGTGHHPPQPVVGTALEPVTGAWSAELAELIADL